MAPGVELQLVIFSSACVFELNVADITIHEPFRFNATYIKHSPHQNNQFCEDC